MSNLKRLRDTENKKMVWAIPVNEPYKKLQVWTNNDGSKLYVYRNSQYLELDTANSTVAEYGHYRKQLDDEMVGYYLTPEPTNLYNWDEGDEASYQFIDWNGTVLKSGKVEEGETPTPPEDPTREATAQYTYTFTGWYPTVAPITKKTTYTAQYEATPRNYTVTIGVSPSGAGTVDTQQVTVAYGTEISYTNNVLMIGSNEITATAETGYEFSTWGTLPETVAEDLTITATFVQSTIMVESVSNISENLTLVESVQTSLSLIYSPTNAENVTDQITVESSDTNIVEVSNQSASDGYYRFDILGVGAGQTTLVYYLNGIQIGTTNVTIVAQIPMSSISAPSANSVSVAQEGYDYSITATYLPANANVMDVLAYSDDNNICDSFWVFSWQNGDITFGIRGNSEGSTQVHYYLNSNPSTIYDIDVTVTAPL